MIRRSWMASGSVEATLELWASSLRDVKGRIRPVFLQDYVVETLAAPDAVLVVDETGFLKQGKASCGVGRQYTGSAGKITNCQIGVFVAYVSGKGHALIDRALYLPKVWTDDRARRAGAHVPESVTFATKPQLARAMIEQAIAADVPFAWVAADSIYGVGEIEMMLRHAGKGYVLGVSASHPFTSWIGKPEVAGTAEAIAGGLPESAWQRLSAGEGTKGERLYDWAYCELADLGPGDYGATWTGLWTRGLLIRRSLADGELAFFSTWCPAGTPTSRLVAVEGRRLAIQAEFAGGLAILAGFYGRLVSVALLPVLLGALFVNAPNGWVFNAPNGGWEYPAFLAVPALAQALIGDGAFAAKPIQFPGLAAEQRVARA